MKCGEIKDCVRVLCNCLTLDDELSLPALVSLLATVAKGREEFTELIRLQLELCLAHAIGDIRDQLVSHLKELKGGDGGKGKVECDVNVEELEDYLKIHKEELRNSHELLAIDFAGIKKILHDYKEVHRERTEMDEIVDMIGKPLFTLPKIYLTEPGDCEVSLIKHIYDEHIVLQYNVQNFLSNLFITNARVKFAELQGFEIVKEICASRISFNETGTCYLVLHYDKQANPFPLAKLKAKLEFKVTEVSLENAEEGTYDDELKIQDTILTANCYIHPLEIDGCKFE